MYVLGLGAQFIDARYYFFHYLLSKYIWNNLILQLKPQTSISSNYIQLHPLTFTFHNQFQINKIKSRNTFLTPTILFVLKLCPNTEAKWFANSIS